MADLISRQDAIKKCQHRLYESAMNNIGYECKADEVFADIAQNRIKTWLNEVPSAERKTGRWIHERLASTNGGTYAVVRCSECHSQFPMWETRFCPNCGAKMDNRSIDDKVSDLPMEAYYNRDWKGEDGGGA